MKIAKYINDNVFGGIGLTENEFKIINTRTFQRLRRIKQQGFNSYTFPSAEHTRFSHSLGVMHIMGKITDHLLEKRIIVPEERKLLRYAALLHDVGHYPLSHLTESVYQYIDFYKQQPNYLSENNKVTDDILPLLRFAEKSRSKEAHHEKLSAEVIKNRKDIRDILELDNIDIDQIGDIIQGNVGKGDNILYHQLLHSNFDADRMDYLIRDSASAGVNFGLIDLDYLIRLFEIGKQKMYIGNKKKDFLCLNEKGIHTLEHYLMARYFSYTQVTLHKTSTAYETLAKSMIWHLIKQEKIYKNVEEIIQVIKNEGDEREFLKFDDSYILRLFGDQNLFQNQYTLYRDAIIERQRIKCVIEIKEIVNKNKQNNSNAARWKEFTKDKINQIAGILNIDPYYLGYSLQKVDVGISKKEARNEEEKFIEACRVYKDAKSMFLFEANSSLISKYLDNELNIFRLFFIDPNPYNKEITNQLVDNGRQKVIDEYNIWNRGGR